MGRLEEPKVKLCCISTKVRCLRRALFAWEKTGVSFSPGSQSVFLLPSPSLETQSQRITELFFNCF